MVGATAGPRQPVRMTAWAACLALLLAAVQASVAEARTFRAADTQAEDYPTVQALMHLDKLLQERTDGRHRLQIFHSRQLGEEKETIEQTRAGAIDLNRVNVAPIASFAPEANVLVLPFLFRSVDHLHRVLDGPIGERDPERASTPSGFVGLTFYDSGARSIYNSVRPIRKLEDLQGPAHPRPAVRSHDRHVQGARRDAGAAALRPGDDRPVDPAHRRRREQLAVLRHDRPLPRGAVLLADRAHDEPGGAGHVARRPGTASSPEDQAIFREAARESSRFMREQWRLWEERSRREAQLGGVTVVEDVDRAAFAAGHVRHLRTLADRSEDQVSCRPHSRHPLRRRPGGGPALAGRTARGARARRPQRPGSSARCAACRSAGASSASRSSTRRSALILLFLIWDGAKALERRLDRAAAGRANRRSSWSRSTARPGRLQSLIHRYFNQPNPIVLAEIIRRREALMSRLRAQASIDPLTAEPGPGADRDHRALHHRLRRSARRALLARRRSTTPTCCARRATWPGSTPSSTRRPTGTHSLILPSLGKSREAFNAMLLAANAYYLSLSRRRRRGGEAQRRDHRAHRAGHGRSRRQRPAAQRARRRCATARSRSAAASAC